MTNALTERMSRQSLARSISPQPTFLKSEPQPSIVTTLSHAVRWFRAADVALIPALPRSHWFPLSLAWDVTASTYEEDIFFCPLKSEQQGYVHNEGIDAYEKAMFHLIW